VKELVEAHGGVVTVMSSEAAGTTFTVRLPASGPALRAEAPSTEAVAHVRRAP
jgi:signal transduction histidine kinase